MTASANDYRYIARALQLAERGLYTVDPNPRVGCVIVHKDEVVGEGWHERAGEHHAEIQALQQAGASATGATAYVTLEPCCHHGRTPPCTDALLSAGISRVVIATTDANPSVSGSGVHQLEAAGIDVETGVMIAEARLLNVGFFRRMETGRPYVRSKIAVSLDGRTALANGISQWITGDAAREDAQRLRAQSSAIMTGAGTIEDDENTSWLLSALRLHALLPLRYAPRLLRAVSRQSDTKQGATAFMVLHVDGATVTFDDLSTDG